MSELQKALLEARSSPDILGALGKLLWAAATDGEDCPDHKIPTPKAMAEWMRDGWAGDVAQEAISRAIVCADIVDAWINDPNPEPVETPEAKEADGLVRAVLLRLASRTAQQSDELRPWFHLNKTHRLWILAHAIAEAKSVDTAPHPIAPIVEAWQRRPVNIEPDTRQDRRILPTIRTVEARPERQRGMLFGGLLEGRDPNPKLPMFEAEPVRKSVAILDLADASGVPVMAKGRGAPLPARLFVRSALAVKLEDRRRESVRMALTVRELRDGLFPNGWRSGQHWPALKAALIGARDYTIRLPDGGRWFMLALRMLPSEDVRGAPSLDDHVVIDLAFPPGASDGPIIDLPVVDALSVESAPRWRAYIAGHTLIWEPGKTRRKLSRKARFVWSREPNDYPVVTREDRKRLAFGEKDRKNRTHAEIDAAWRDLPGLDMMEKAIDPRTGEVGWRIMPADVAQNSDKSETGD